jgi:cyclopropane-fatty-acyl-phospholipid synthase
VGPAIKLRRRAPEDRFDDFTELKQAVRRSGRSCEIGIRGQMLGFGEEPPAFRVVFKNERALRRPLDEFSFLRCYVEGDIDLEGDIAAIVELRDYLRNDLRPVATLRQSAQFVARLFLRSAPRLNTQSISHHYTHGNDFYLSFIDTRFRFYSHCVFHSDTETLEEAAEHKLERMWQALDLRPGMRLLDIGGGWGGVTEYCGSRGVHVTSLTMVEESADYIRNLIREKSLLGEVIVEDFLLHRPAQPYDHAVGYGVSEHIPAYRRFCEQLWSALKPGGRLYLDASATKEKYAMSPITRRYIWQGTHTFLALQDMIEELLYHGFEIVEVRRETRDYELTIRNWAQRLDANRDQIVERWGEQLYRAFRLYLWGGAHAFKTNRLQAYHLVAERRPDAGRRPGNWRRFGHYLTSLR